MDICYIEDIEQIISFEKFRDKAEVAKTCMVANIFNKWHKEESNRNKLTVVNAIFPKDLEVFVGNIKTKRYVVFYDMTGWFSAEEADELTDLLKRHLVKEGDIFIITSSLDFSGWRHVKIKAAFECNRLCYKNITEDELKNNIVDLFVMGALSNYNAHDRIATGGRKQISAELIGKVKYQDDGHMAMGVWAFIFKSGENRLADFRMPFKRTLMSGKEPELFKDIFEEE